MDWIAFLHVFTIVNKVLLFFLFFFRKNNSLANRLLALLILLPVFPILSNYIFYIGYLSSFPGWLFFTQILFSLFGPIFLFYCLEVTGRQFKFSKDKLLHLIPCLFVILLWIKYILSDELAHQKLIDSFVLGDEGSAELIVASAGPLFVVLVYIILSAKIVYRHRIAFKEVFTNIEGLKVNYIREFINVIILGMVILAIVYKFNPVLYVNIVWIPIVSNLMYFYIIYKSYNCGVIFSEKDYKEFQKLYIPLNQYMEDSRAKKYAGSTLSEFKVREYAYILNTGFENEQWYLDPELNLSVVSEKSGIAAHYISQTINQCFDKNFFDYVNAYRVAELKSKLKNPDFDHFKLEELAYMCGFNSKAAYQRAFKKHTKMTPTEYKNSELQSTLSNVE